MHTMEKELESDTLLIQFHNLRFTNYEPNLFNPHKGEGFIHSKFNDSNYLFKSKFCYDFDKTYLRGAYLWIRIVKGHNYFYLAGDIEARTKKKNEPLGSVLYLYRLDSGICYAYPDTVIYGDKKYELGNDLPFLYNKELDEKDQLIELIYQNRSTIRKLIDLDTMDNSKLFESLMRRMKIYLVKKSYI